MPSAEVDILDSKGVKIRARTQLDTCATANFMTFRLIKRLRLLLVKGSFSIGALNNLSTTVNGMGSVTFKSIHGSYEGTLHFLVVLQITDAVSNHTVPREQFSIPHGMRLADPNFHQPL